MGNRTKGFQGDPFRRKVLRGMTGIAVSALLPGCGSSSSSSSPSASAPAASPTAAPAPVSVAPNAQPVPPGPITAASVTVLNATAGGIGPAFAGLSYEKAALYEPLFSGSNLNLIGLFKRLGTSVLRVGGNSVDKTVWTPGGAGKTVGQIAPSDVAALAAFLKATGWQCLYGINLGGAASGATTAALAAAEVAYVRQVLGSSLLGIEIGNECDLYGDAGSYFSGAWSLTQFETLWGEYRASILASSPGVPITGPASASHESTWTVPFGKAVTASQITLLTQHYYRANGQLPTSTVEYLVTPDSTLIGYLGTLKAGAEAIGIPYRMAECNSYYNGGAVGVSDTYASSLWVIDYLFDCAKGGASGVNFHGGGDGNGYTPIANSGAAIVGARPEFYGIVLFTLAGEGALQQTEVSAGSLNVTGYAVSNASGGQNVVIVNKELSQNLLVTIDLPEGVASASLIAMTQLSPGATGPSLSGTSGVSIQGAPVGVDGSFSPERAYDLIVSGETVKCYVPALSAVLVQTS